MPTESVPIISNEEEESFSVNCVWKSGDILETKTLANINNIDKVVTK